MSIRLLVAALLLLRLLLAQTSWAEESTAFRIETDVEGVVRVGHSDLVEAGLGNRFVGSNGLGLTHRGQPVPIYVLDGDDGGFGPGDAFEFVAERLSGERSHLHEHSRVNVYRLALDTTSAARISSASPTAEAEGAAPEGVALWSRRHLERDRLLIRLQRDESETADSWYWTKLSHVDREPFRIDLDLSTLDTASSEAVRIRVAFRGLSHTASGEASDERLSDHRVELSFDGEPATAVEWTGREAAIASFTRPARSLTPGTHALEARVPRRRQPDGDGLLLDVVMLDWLEIQSPDTGVSGPVQRQLHFEGADPTSLIRLGAGAGERGALYTLGGLRIASPESGPWSFAPPGTEGSFWLTGEATPGGPAAVALDAPSRLATTDRQADYLIVTHASLIEATEPLAAMHRRRGLTVEIVDVQDIYDEFNDGILDPRAIRDFVAHAVHRWQAPAPRFLLLVGDASWDTKNDTVDDRNYANWVDRQLLGERGRFAAKPTATYDQGTAANDRNLVPTWSHPSHEGHAASDNYFVAVVGDDHLPDLAVGRLPFVEPEDVAAVVEKIVRYTQNPPLGPWRSRLLWVANETYAFRVRSEALAGRLGADGWAATTVFPTPSSDLDGLRRALVQGLDEGQLVTHFVGHGGRFEWRIAAPDLERQTDLFTLDDLETLTPTETPTLVLSIACHSAPFDHPSADSIGEGFLRLPGRGAVGVVAASWRNAPGPELSDALMTELLSAPTVGEAVLRAKRRLVDRELVATYNLLGDPALPPARPQRTAKVERLPVSNDGGTAVRVVFPDEALGGRAVVDWLDEKGVPVVEQLIEHVVAIEDFEAPTAARALRVYFWNEENGTDGLVGLDLQTEPSRVTAIRP